MKIRDMVQQEKGSLAADCLVILDGGNRTVDHGTLETSTRGIVSLELTVNALNQPVHSGTGGLAPDPAQALAALIASLREPRRIRGFTDGCLALSPQERALLRESSTSEEEYRAENGVIKGATLRGSPNESVFERVVEEPSITIVNMTSGERNGSNSVQASARCKIGVRLTPGQDPDHVQRVIQQHFERQLIGCPFTLERVGLACKAWKGSLDGPYTQAYLAALRETYPKIALMPTGGALPLITDFEEAFPKMETIIVGVEDPHTAAHSHNESQSLPVLRRAIDALIGFLGKAAKAASAKRDA
jgi:acetylornithine deacetylase/succinyl-diaminopimelate desuccinylase-like protein